ncbi:hypothetical protein D3M95_04100 [Corynebacterium falsenii]|uniref:DUF2134 domain-containing protein n=1 Tax=Corynebacterium falsenii TaxID=108486 RepID=A0A418Q8E0_9CORY|nr:hypothetical protein D3M95_04100 [Corynebacterium falsenii]
MLRSRCRCSSRPATCSRWTPAPASTSPASTTKSAAKAAAVTVSAAAVAPLFFPFLLLKQY